MYAVCAVLIIIFLTPIGGWKALNVLTGSMKPTIRPGALVLVHRVPLRDIRPGDIVTYRNPVNSKQTITHRVTKLEKMNGVTMVTVKGDANATPDKPFPGGLIVGRVEFSLPAVGGYLEALHNPFALAALVIIPGLIVIWAEVQRLRKILARPAAQPDKIPPTDEPPTPPAAPPVGPTSRRMDGMRRMVALILMGAVISAALGSTYAAVIGNVSLTHNSFTALDIPLSAADCKNGGWETYLLPDGTPMFKNQGQCIAFVNALSHGQCAEIHINNTGQGSSNVVICRNSHHSNTANTNTVNITNTNNQTSTSGGVSNDQNTNSGSSTSGNASASSNTTTNVILSPF
jgi:signal peptidase